MGIFRNFTGSKHDAVSAIESAELSLAKSAEAERDESTLESVTSCVMVADENNIIVKVNPAAMEMMRIAEKDIRRELPTFSVASLVGSNIDIFHKNPAHQRRMLESLSSTHKGQITVGARTFRLTANPIFNDSQTRLGTVVEWEDVSDKLSREKLALAKAEQEKVAAAANSRIKAALDCVSSNVMMADADNVIIYTNDSVMRMLRNAEADVRKELPSFNTDTIVGSSVDIFHKNPAHQKSMLASLKDTHRAQIVVGGRTFALI
ncbi:MAG: PAS domain-containing protein, partial [Pseudohongiella sp.]|nr:PAS domain-containing protein [Pseudohongiella sp.]